jgi:hypothetical protein
VYLDSQAVNKHLPKVAIFIQIQQYVFIRAEFKPSQASCSEVCNRWYFDHCLSLHTTGIRRLSYRFDMLGVSSKFSDMPGVFSDMLRVPADAQCISSPYDG